MCCIVLSNTMSNPIEIVKYVMKNRGIRSPMFADSEWSCTFPKEIITNILKFTPYHCLVFSLANKNLYNFIMYEYVGYVETNVSNFEFMDYYCAKMVTDKIMNNRTFGLTWIDYSITGRGYARDSKPLSILSSYCCNHQCIMALERTRIYTNQYPVNQHHLIAKNDPRITQYTFLISYATSKKIYFDGTFMSNVLDLDHFDSLGLIHKTCNSFIWLFKKRAKLFLLEYWMGTIFNKVFNMGRHTNIVCTVYNPNSNIISLVTDNNFNDKRILMHIVGNNSWLWED